MKVPVLVALLVGTAACSSQSSEAIQIEFEGADYYGGASDEYEIPGDQAARIGFVASATPEELTGDPVFALEGVDPDLAVAVLSDFMGAEAYHVFWRSGAEFPEELCRFVKANAQAAECGAAGAARFSS